MGRHTNGIAALFSAMRGWTERQREIDRQAQALPDDQKRILHRQHARRRQEAMDAGRRWLPKRPEYLRNLTCGAWSRSGRPCRMTALFANGRCIWHGGKSTGPRTEEGRARALTNLKLGRLKRGKSRD